MRHLLRRVCCRGRDGTVGMPVQVSQGKVSWLLITKAIKEAHDMMHRVVYVNGGIRRAWELVPCIRMEFDDVDGGGGGVLVMR